MIESIKRFKIPVMLLCGMFISQQLNSQTIVSASMDSTSIMIGEQTYIHLDITTDQGKKIEWPALRDTITAGIRLLEVGEPDTTKADNNRLQIKRDYLITSFDSALYVIPPFTLIEGADTLKTNSLILKVMTFTDVDPEKGFFDIKPVLDPDFVLADYYPYIWAVLITLFLFSVLMYILQKRKKKEPIFSFGANQPKLPPHLEAINKLDRIKVEKLWQHGKNKEYYTEVTEVLRKYIMDRFGVNALEMTSEEILGEIYRLHDAHSVYDTLKQILELSDLVKFAKYVPDPNDNEISILSAYLFVNQTKIEELKLPGKEDAPEVTENNNAK